MKLCPIPYECYKLTLVVSLLHFPHSLELASKLYHSNLYNFKSTKIQVIRIYLISGLYFPIKNVYYIDSSSHGIYTEIGRPCSRCQVVDNSIHKCVVRVSHLHCGYSRVPGWFLQQQLDYKLQTVNNVWLFT